MCLTIANSPPDGIIEGAMRKTRLYLDTSPIIMIGPNQDPIRRAITEDFFRIVAESPGEYELFVSPVTLEELRAGIEKHGDGSILFLNSLEHTELAENEEAEKLAVVYTYDSVLSKIRMNDLRHVAYAVVSHCDYVVTWNMRHLANDKTVGRANAVNSAENHGKIFITTAEFFTGGKIYGK